jgi:hypothetical protein
MITPIVNMASTRLLLLSWLSPHTHIHTHAHLACVAHGRQLVDSRLEKRLAFHSLLVVDVSSLPQAHGAQGVCVVRGVQTARGRQSTLIAERPLALGMGMGMGMLLLLLLKVRQHLGNRIDAFLCGRAMRRIVAPHALNELGERRRD